MSKLEVKLNGKTFAVEWQHYNPAAKDKKTGELLFPYPDSWGTECIIRTKSMSINGGWRAKVKLHPNDKFNRYLGRKYSLAKVLRGVSREHRGKFWEAFHKEWSYDKTKK